MNADELHRELRLHRFGLFGTTALLALLLLTGAAGSSPDELRARRLTLLDAEGTPVAVLEGVSSGARLVSPTGGTARAIEWSLAGEGATFGLRDDTGTLRLGATAERRGSGFVVLDPGGRVRAELRTADGNAELFLRDPNGKARVGAAALKDAGGLQVFDAVRPRVTLEVAQGRSRLLMMDPDQVPRLFLQAGVTGENGIQLRDGRGRPIWEELEAKPPAPPSP